VKILQVTPFFKPMWESGGVARVAYDISRHLQQRGHEVTVYTTNMSTYRRGLPTNRPVDLEGMTVYYFENLRKFFPGRTVPVMPYYLPFVARKEMREFDIVHIHEHRTLLAVWASRYARRYGVPYILQQHGSLPRDRIMGKVRIKEFFDRVWGNGILEGASRVIAINAMELEQNIGMGVERSRITVIPNGVDPDRCRTERQKGEFRQEYGIPGDTRVVLYLGRIDQIKGIDFLVDAYGLLAREVGDTVLAIVGPEWGYRQVLEKRVNSLGIGDRVIFISYIDDVAFAYQDADVLVYPGKYEIFGLVAFEAILCGTPVIVTEGSGSADFVRESNCGYLVEYGNVHQLKECMKTCIEDPGEGRRMALRGQRYIRETLAWDRVIERLLKEYQRCL